jgi:acyl-coenzyme A thioesterase PaaI-like protein
MTQVWDAKVTHEQSGKTIAHFRFTQMILFEALNDCLR